MRERPTVKHTVRLYEGQLTQLQELSPSGNGNALLRDIVESYIVLATKQLSEAKAPKD